MSFLTKAVIPAAGLGTRFLPASKAIPKEMITVVDRPALQYVVAEAAAAGFEEICLVTSQTKPALISHFEPNPRLVDLLKEKGETQLAAQVEEVAQLAAFATVEQDQPLGLGHAVSCAEEWVGAESFAVLLGDDFLDKEDYVLHKMTQLHQATGAAVLLLMEVPEDQTQLYGVVEASPYVLEPNNDLDDLADIEVHQISRLQEKPAPGEAYSNLAVIGRYVFGPQIFPALAKVTPGRGGEIQLTDAIDDLAKNDQAGVLGIVFRGQRYDTGDKLGYLQAVVQLGLKHPELGEEFAAWLSDFVKENH